MAAEITLSINLRVANGSFVEQFSPGQQSIDQTVVGRGGYVQSIGIADQVVTIGTMTNFGYAVLRNLDATNFVTFGPESGGALVPFGKLKPGEIAIVRLKPGIVLRAQADTAPVKLDVRVYEN